MGRAHRAADAAAHRPATPEKTKKADLGVKKAEMPGSTIDENGVQNFGVLPDPKKAKIPSLATR